MSWKQRIILFLEWQLIVFTALILLLFLMGRFDGGIIWPFPRE